MNLNRHIRFHPFAFVMLLLALAIGLSLATAPAQATPMAQVYGKTYGEWSANWWQWIRSIPKADNPLLGGDVNQNQNGPVFFLGGTVGGEATVPQGKALFFPMINIMFHNGPGESLTKQEKRDILYEYFLPEDLVCTLDGIPVVLNHQTPMVRTQSPPFPIAIEPNDVYDMPPAYDPEAISDGVWVMLPPLSKGEHVLHFSGASTHPDFSWSVDVTYELTVEPGAGMGRGRLK